MSEIVKRVAERISDELKLHKQGLDWEDPDGPIQRAAREAIKAMREPTQAMHQAGEKAWMNRNLRDPNSNPLDDCYRAMISEALKEVEERPASALANPSET
jgi:hypothetical protein